MVCLTRPVHNSRTNSRRIIKIGSKVAHDMSNIAAMLLHPGGHTVMAEPGGHTSCYFMQPESVFLTIIIIIIIIFLHNNDCTVVFIALETDRNSVSAPKHLKCSFGYGYNTPFHIAGCCHRRIQRHVIPEPRPQ